jgi:hypothetical protein
VWFDGMDWSAKTNAMPEDEERERAQRERERERER